MRKKTLTLIFRPIIRTKFPEFYLSDTATKRRKERKKGFQCKAYLGRIYRQMSVFRALISAGKKIRLSNFGYEKDTENRISPCERTLWALFFGLSFGRNFRHYTFRIPPRKGEKREKNGFQFKAYLGRMYRQMSVFPALISAEKKFGLITSATKKILKNGFHHAKEHFQIDFSAYHSGEISGILHFRSRHEKPKTDKNKRISFLCVTLPNLKTDVTFTGTDFARKKIFRLIKFGNRKEIEKRISPCETTLSPWFFDLSFGRNFRNFTRRAYSRPDLGNLRPHLLTF